MKSRRTAIIIFKDAQANNFVGQGLYLGLAIVVPYAKQHQQLLTDLADDPLIDSHAGTADAL